MLENGIGEEDNSEYYKKYVKRHLEIIDDKDLKQYFINYPILSHIHQMVLEFQNDRTISGERRNMLYRLMEILYSNGIGEKYVPITEVKQILEIQV